MALNKWSKLSGERPGCTVFTVVRKHDAPDRLGKLKKYRLSNGAITLSCLNEQSILSSRNTRFDETSDWNTLGIFLSATRLPSRGSVTDLSNSPIHSFKHGESGTVRTNKNVSPSPLLKSAPLTTMRLTHFPKPFGSFT